MKPYDSFLCEEQTEI